MTKKEKYYLFVTLQTILNEMKWHNIGEMTVDYREHNNKLDTIINQLEELKGKLHG